MIRRKILLIMTAMLILQFNLIMSMPFSLQNVSDPSRCQLPRSTILKLDAAYELIKSGQLVPAANFNGMTPDSFTTIEEE